MESGKDNSRKKHKMTSNTERTSEERAHRGRGFERPDDMKALE